MAHLPQNMIDQLVAEGRLTISPPIRLPDVQPVRIEGLKLSEAVFQDQVIALAQSRGFLCAHFRRVRVMRKDGTYYWETPVAAGGKGFPDLILARESTGTIYAWELKVDDNTPTAEQEIWLRVLSACGIPTAVFWPEDMPRIEELLK